MSVHPQTYPHPAPSQQPSYYPFPKFLGMGELMKGRGQEGNPSSGINQRKESFPSLHSHPVCPCSSWQWGMGGRAAETAAVLRADSNSGPVLLGGLEAQVAERA